MAYAPFEKQVAAQKRILKTFIEESRTFQTKESTEELSKYLENLSDAIEQELLTTPIEKDAPVSALGYCYVCGQEKMAEVVYTEIIKHDWILPETDNKVQNISLSLLDHKLYASEKEIETLTKLENSTDWLSFINFLDDLLVHSNEQYDKDRCEVRSPSLSL